MLFGQLWKESSTRLFKITDTDRRAEMLQCRAKSETLVRKMSTWSYFLWKYWISCIKCTEWHTWFSIIFTIFFVILKLYFLALKLYFSFLCTLRYLSPSSFSFNFAPCGDTRSGTLYHVSLNWRAPGTALQLTSVCRIYSLHKSQFHT